MSEKNAMTSANMALTFIYQRAACCSLAGAALSSCFLVPAKAYPHFLPLEERWELGKQGQFKPIFKDVIFNYPSNGYQGTFILRDGRRRKFRIWVEDTPVNQRVVRYGVGMNIKRNTFNCLSSKTRNWVRSKVLIKAAWLTGCHGKVASYRSQPVKYGYDPLRDPKFYDFVDNVVDKVIMPIVNPDHGYPSYRRRYTSGPGVRG